MITAVEGGVVLDLRVQPGAARTTVAGTYSEAIKVKVAAPPVDGRANAAVLRLIAEEFGVRPGQVALLSGESSRSKRVRVEGITPDQARSWLAGKVSHVTDGQ